MTRSLLRPIRTRRVVRNSNALASEAGEKKVVSPATRKTLAAIGALWVSFAATASAGNTSATGVATTNATTNAGVSSMSEAQAVEFLTTANRPDGSTPRLPMPDYRLNDADASAVATCLKSLSK
jgi:hypothetical protein